MKIKFKYYFPHFSEKWVCVAYFKAGKWRIYDYGSSFLLKKNKDVVDLLDEVASEMHVRPNKIKIVKPLAVDFKEVKIKVGK
jgi:hypothetical protein